MRSLCRTSPLEVSLARSVPLIACLTLAACGGEDEVIGPPPVVASVDVTPQTATIAALGWRVQLSAIARDSSGSPILGADVEWSSSAAAVATVDSSGLATAMGNGSAAISAKADGSSATATIVVRQEPAYLDFTSQPTATIAGDTIGPVVEVAIKDWGGNVVSDATDTVTVTLDANAGNAVLGGTTTLGAVGGVASFSDLFIDRVARGYTLAATSQRLYGATSAAFDIWPSLARIDSVGLLQYPQTDPPRSSDTLYVDRFRVEYAVSVSSMASSTMPAVTLRGYIDQGAASRAGGESAVVCDAVAGDLPPGTCAFNATLRASNTAAGSGTLVQGDATARFELIDGVGDAVLDSLTRPVTLLETVEPPLPQVGIDSVNLNPTTLPIGTQIYHTVTVTNEEGDTVSGFEIQAYIDQGFAWRAAGVTNVRCGVVSDGIPPGTCSFDFPLRPWNAGAGTGTLVPGPATARVELRDYVNERVVDTFFVPVRLYSH